jgi:hypothetical protein
VLILYDEKNFFLLKKNAIWVSKNAEFDDDFKAVGNVAKYLMWKKLSMKK